MPSPLACLGLVVLGSVADLAALIFAPQSVIAPLGSLTLVSNSIFAPILLQEKIGYREIIATILIVVGAAIAVSFGPHADVVYSVEQLFNFYTRGPFIAYALAIAIYMGVLYTSIKKMEMLETINPTSPQYIKLRPYHRFAYASISGTVGAQSVLFAKCSVELIANSIQGKGMMFKYYQTYFVLSAMFCTIFLQIGWLNNGLRRFDSAYTVPVFQSFWIVISVCSGMVFYKEYSEMSQWEGVMFSCGVLITIVGVLVLSAREVEPPSKPHSCEVETDQQPQQPYLSNVRGSNASEVSLAHSGDEEDSKPLLRNPNDSSS